jgi:hypothetical protein
MSYRAIVVLPDHNGDNHVAGGEVIYEADQSPVNTGLVTAQGVPIYRFSDRRPIGFNLLGKPK